MNTALHFSSAKQDWATPWDFFKRLDDEFHFDLDVCATAENAKCKLYFSPADGVEALRIPWTCVCWMNPPYGRELPKWIKKAYESSRDNHATVVCLIPARTDTSYWHDYVMKASEVRLVRGRLTFEGAPYPAPFPSAVVIFRPERYVEGLFKSMPAKLK